MMVLSRHYVRSTFAMCLVVTSKSNCKYSGNCQQNYSCHISDNDLFTNSSSIFFHVKQFYYPTCVIELLTLCNKVTHVV